MQAVSRIVHVVQRIIHGGLPPSVRGRFTCYGGLLLPTAACCVNNNVGM